MHVKKNKKKNGNDYELKKQTKKRHSIETEKKTAKKPL